MNAFINMLLVVAIASLFVVQDVHTEERTMNKLQITSPVFPHNGMIPSKFTCDGADVSPTSLSKNLCEKRTYGTVVK